MNDDDARAEIEAAVARELAPRFRLISPAVLGRICLYKTAVAAWGCDGRVMLQLEGSVDFVESGPLPIAPRRS